MTWPDYVRFRRIPDVAESQRERLLYPRNQTWSAPLRQVAKRPRWTSSTASARGQRSPAREMLPHKQTPSTANVPKEKFF